MTLTISKCKLSKQQHTTTLNYTLGENEKNSLIFTLMICRNFFAHRNAVCKTRDGLAHLIKWENCFASLLRVIHTKYNGRRCRRQDLIFKTEYFLGRRKENRLFKRRK